MAEVEIMCWLRGPTHGEVMNLAEFINRHDKQDHVHYGCSWALRKDGIYHICIEKHVSWKIEEAQP